jgi:hypothetical protein
MNIMVFARWFMLYLKYGIITIHHLYYKIPTISCTNFDFIFNAINQFHKLTHNWEYVVAITRRKFVIYNQFLQQKNVICNYKTSSYLLTFYWCLLFSPPLVHSFLFMLSLLVFLIFPLSLVGILPYFCSMQVLMLLHLPCWWCCDPISNIH